MSTKRTMGTEHEDSRRIAATLTTLTDLTQTRDLVWTPRPLGPAETPGFQLLMGLRPKERYEANWKEDALRLDIPEIADSAPRILKRLHSPVQLSVREADGSDYMRFPPPPYFSTFDSYLMDLYRAVRSQFDEVPEGFIDRVLSS